MTDTQKRALKVFLLSSIGGPPIGSLVYLLPTVLGALLDSITRSSGVAPPTLTEVGSFFLISILFAFATGGIAACFFAIVAGLRVLRRGTFTLLFALVAGAVAAVVGAYGTSVWIDRANWSDFAGMLTVIFPPSVISALFIWLIARRFGWIKREIELHGVNHSVSGGTSK